MASPSSSLSFALSPLPLCNSKPSLSFALHSSKPLSSPSALPLSPMAFAAPQPLESKETLAGSESSISLEAEESELSPSAIGCDDDKNMEQKIRLTNNNGETIVGVLHDAGSRELVVLCHGFRSSKESSTITSLADALKKEKISIFLFDFSGNGESGGSFQYGNYWKEVDDLRTVILYFMKQRRPVSAIIGHSKGGNVVLLYASKHHDIPIAINVSVRFDLKKGIGGRLGMDFMKRIEDDGFIDKMDRTGRFLYRVTKESLMDRLSTDMCAACTSINDNCRILTVHGSADSIVPTEDALKFDQLISNHKLHIIEGADHTYQCHRLQLAVILLDFIRGNEVEDGCCELRP